jgi:hypothetical protein
MGFDGVKKQDRKSHAWAPLSYLLKLIKLTRMLRIRLRNWSVCWAYASVSEAYAAHTLQFLKRMLRVCLWEEFSKTCIQKIVRARIEKYLFGVNKWAQKLPNFFFFLPNSESKISLSVCSAYTKGLKMVPSGPKNFKKVQFFLSPQLAYPDEVCWWKKRRGKKSHACAPLSSKVQYMYMLQMAFFKTFIMNFEYLNCKDSKFARKKKITLADQRKLSPLFFSLVR